MNDNHKNARLKKNEHSATHQFERDPFINDANLENVTDPLDGEVCPLNSADVSIHLSQMAIRGTTDLSHLRWSRPKLGKSWSDLVHLRTNANGSKT